jgi:hypothetical protein
VSENFKNLLGSTTERKALTLLEGIVKENSESLKLEGNRLTIRRSDGIKYNVELSSSKVYSDSGRFICVRVLSPGLPIIDQVIAKAIYLLTSPRPSSDLDHDLLYKVTFAGLDPNHEWPWIRSFSQTSLGNTFSTLIGADFAVKGIKVKGLAVKLQLWYVNYGSKFESIRVKHVRGSMGAVILCNDRTANNNSESIQATIEELRSCNERRLPMMLIRLYDETSNHGGDGSSEMSKGEEIARRNGIPFFACSVNHPSTTAKPLVFLTEMMLGRQPTDRAALS